MRKYLIIQLLAVTVMLSSCGVSKKEYAKLQSDYFKIQKELNDARMMHTSPDPVSDSNATSIPEPNPPIKKELKLSIKFSTLRVRANIKNSATIIVLLDNSDTTDLHANIKVTGASCKTNSINVPANGRARFSVSFSDVIKFEKRNLTIEALVGGKVIKRTVSIDLEPNFDDL